MFKVLIGILVIGFFFLIVIVAIVATLLKKGSKFLFKPGYKKFSSSDFKFRGHHNHHGHHSYGHLHYHRKHASHSFFSS
jgi:hypothetical protein